MKKLTRAGLAAAAMTVPFMAGTAHADAVSNFYKGKTVTMVVGFSAGGMYGLNARLMSRHLGKYIPGKPTVVVQHMSGAGGANAANYMYNAAAKDGSFISELSKDIAVAQVLRPKRIKYNASDFHYLGRMNPYAAVLMIWHSAGVKTLEDAKKKQVIVANSGKSSHSWMEAALLRHFVGLKLKLVTGYRGAGGMYKAMESGEVHARIGAWVSLKAVKGAWLRDGKVYVIVQDGLKKQPDLPDLPLMIDLMPNEEARKMAEVMSLGGPVGWGLTAPPGTPMARVSALRAAFQKMVKDPAFLEDAKKRKAPVDSATGEFVASMVKKTLDVSPALIKKMQKIAGFKN